MYPLFEGMILGMTLAIMLGPALFTLIQTSIHRGLYRAAILATGIFFSDLALVWLCFVGATQILGNSRNGIVFGVIGGIILMVFGVITYLRKANISPENVVETIKKPTPVTYIFKGFFLNIANPFVWLFWMSVMVTVSARYGAGTFDTKLFFIGTLITIFSSDLLKVFVAHQLKRYLKPKFLIGLNHAVGVVLVIFGIFLVIRTIINF